MNHSGVIAQATVCVIAGGRGHFPHQVEIDSELNSTPLQNNPHELAVWQVHLAKQVGKVVPRKDGDNLLVQDVIDPFERGSTIPTIMPFSDPSQNATVAIVLLDDWCGSC